MCNDDEGKLKKLLVKLKDKSVFAPVTLPIAEAEPALHYGLP